MMRGLGLGDDHQPARILVEAMYDPRPAAPADAGQTGAAMAEHGIHERPVWVSRGGMNNHAGRLVDDDQMCILEADIERDRLRLRRRIFRLRENYDEILVVFDAQRGVSKGLFVLGDVSGLDQAFEPCPRQFGEMQREHAIQPAPIIVFVHPDRPRCPGGRSISRHRSLSRCAASRSWLWSWA